mmetsp:Transcript_8957/g.15016  ORF Transcript_8957/g.15016 Transcript_8957/m.15016 type:complete len:83 (-) Transcript_8957:246-494(-)
MLSCTPTAYGSAMPPCRAAAMLSRGLLQIVLECHLTPCSMALSSGKATIGDNDEIICWGFADGRIGSWNWGDGYRAEGERCK